MKYPVARKIVICWSLLITGCQLIFFLVAPALGYPLEHSKNIDLLQIVTPVFLGYLGSATHFAFTTKYRGPERTSEYLAFVIYGPLLIYTLAIVGVLIAFGYSNRAGAPIPGGMSVADLSTSISAILGVSAATTSISVSYLFS